MAWKIPLFDLDVGDEEIAAVCRVLKSGWISMGEATKELERVFAQAHNAEYGVAVSSCTAALHLALEALDICPGTSADYFFWTGESKKKSAVGDWQRSLRKLFKLAGVHGGHPHRFRDTFAVELLLKGVPMERVSILLGHSSVRITERHYNPWVRARQEQLEADVRRTWGEDPLVLSETKGTPEVHERVEAVN